MERNPDYTPADQARFAEDAAEYLALRKGFEDQFNGMFGVFFKDSVEQEKLRADLRKSMRDVGGGLLVTPEVRFHPCA